MKLLHEEEMKQVEAKHHEEIKEKDHQINQLTSEIFALKFKQKLLDFDQSSEVDDDEIPENENKVLNAMSKNLMEMVKSNINQIEEHKSDNSDGYEDNQPLAHHSDEQFTKLVNELLELKEKEEVFTDNDFRAGPGSLIINWNEKSERVKKITDEWSQFTWRRVSDIKSFQSGEG